MKKVRIAVAGKEQGTARIVLNLGTLNTELLPDGKLAIDLPVVELRIQGAVLDGGFYDAMKDAGLQGGDFDRVHDAAVAAAQEVLIERAMLSLID